MIAFATLFLGLVIGVQPVELIAADEVARVELLLDGRLAAEIAGEPWMVSADFGLEIAPRELVAVAFDASGAELGRARQLVNVPRPAAEAELVVEEGAEGSGGIAHLRWESTVGASPVAWTVTFDGELLPVAEPRRFELPATRGDAFHFLRAELDFGRGVVATAEATVGGRYASAVSSDLTAVPVEVDGRGKLTVAEAARALRLGDGRPAPVVAVEKGAADLLFVPDASARSAIDEMTATFRRRTRARGSSGFGAAARVGLRHLMPLDGDDRLHVVWPRPQRQERATYTLEAFTRSSELSPWEGGLLFHLITQRLSRFDSPQRLADAVGAAGLLAAAGNNRRAVVLLLGETPVDASQFDAHQVRRYLESVHVPLEVWTTREESVGRPTGWGELVDASSLDAMDRALSRLEKRLGRQRVVWLDGAYLPRDVAAVPGARVALASSPAPPWTAVIVEEVVAREVLEIAAQAPMAPPTYEGADERRLDRALDLLGETRPLPLGPWALYTDVDDERLHAALARVARQLESAYAARYSLMATAGEGEAVVLFASDEDYREYEAVEEGLHSLGVIGHAGNGLAVISAEGLDREELEQIVVHELTHLLNRRAVEGATRPWLEEGMATDLGSCRIDRSGRLVLESLAEGTSTVTISKGPSLSSPAMATAVQKGPRASLRALVDSLPLGPGLALEELFDLEAREFLSGDREMRYAASGFLVRYLLDGDDQRWRASFLEFLRSVASGGPDDADALLAHLDTTVEELEGRFSSWLRFKNATLRYTQ